MDKINYLMHGFKQFKQIYYSEHKSTFSKDLRHGQNPRFAIIACSDSRVDPAIVLQTEPGDVFAIRNVAALVPPCEDIQNDKGYHGTSAALEFAVLGLKVEHIIIIGHVQCGGVANMVKKHTVKTQEDQFLSKWTDLLEIACERALKLDPTLTGDDLLRASEKQSVKLSLDNLSTFPFITEAVEKGNLQLHGWYLNIFDATLEKWDDRTNSFNFLVK